MSLFDSFFTQINTNNRIADIRNGLIGHSAMIEGPNGPKKMIYADYVASGRALRQIEDLILTDILPFYANSHTEASYVGGKMTRLRQQARDVIRECCGATHDHAVVFTGSGATHGINRLVHLFGIKEHVEAGQPPLVILGPYEHHSNILPWRESGAEVVELPEAACGGPCRKTLAKHLADHVGRPVVVSLSAASNVTGVTSDVAAITQQIKSAGARVVWDYAGGGPYLPIRLTPSADAAIDAIVLSPHKFVGGPQASGVLIVRQDAVQSVQPTFPGGGTVRFVSPTSHDYSNNLEAREEAGTPNVIGDVRAALCMLVKKAVGQDFISQRNTQNHRKVIEAWKDHPNIELLGDPDCERLPIFSFRVRDGSGGYVHQQLITRMLSDRYGIQARGGCACAGPYVHRLLGIEEAASQAMRQSILSGDEIEKPGFTRLNFSFLMEDAEVAYIIRSVLELASDATSHVAHYRCDSSRAIFRPISEHV